MIRSTEKAKIGLVLSGGGARGAYQAGAIQAITEIAASANITRPFPVLTGVSAGAINASYLAAKAEDIFQAAQGLAEVWSKIHSDRVFKTDAMSAGLTGLRFVSDTAFGALYSKKFARALLDTAPLQYLLTDAIPFENIGRNIQRKHIDSLAITAMNYTTNQSITFVQADPSVHMWSRLRRRSEHAEIHKEHVMASSAIPLFFPPVRVGNDHYGDGCVRNTAPLSPAIHLGADRLLVISVRKPDSLNVPVSHGMEPTLARVLGVILNALILDAIDVDMERMGRVNQTINQIPEKQRHELQLRKIDYYWVRPSEDLGNLAGDLFNRLPRVIRYLIGGLGSSKEAAELTSYLLFDPDYCGHLVKAGYADVMAQHSEILHFMTAVE